MPARLPPLFAALCALASPLAADDSRPAAGANGHVLLAECGEIVDFLDTGINSATSIGGSYCLGMVNGMLNLNYIYQARRPAEPLFCLPREVTVTNAEAARVVVDYLKQHPEQLDLDQASLMFFAFRKTYPCH
ncbi:MAG: Rap1a/Tai family immunity protein [Porticoccaceae bacterium]